MLFGCRIETGGVPIKVGQVLRIVRPLQNLIAVDVRLGNESFSCLGHLMGADEMDGEQLLEGQRSMLHVSTTVPALTASMAREIQVQMPKQKGCDSVHVGEFR